jgi:hypothetical protein
MHIHHITRDKVPGSDKPGGIEHQPRPKRYLMGICPGGAGDTIGPGALDQDSRDTTMYIHKYNTYLESLTKCGVCRWQTGYSRWVIWLVNIYVHTLPRYVCT